ncbi:MAG: hypothetical protein ACT4QE_17870 [Anaerolineales bacterium]
MPERESTEFFSLGLQYFVAARFAAIAQLGSVVGNLFHHAVEMLLKGHLANKMSLLELKGKGHRLEDLWMVFKSNIGDATLNRFDPTIAKLDKFESIRYPDRIISQGMMMKIGLVDCDESLDDPTHPEPAYDLCVEDIDRLVNAIFQMSNINPRFFTPRFNSHARIYLEKDNRAPLA